MCVLALQPRDAALSVTIDLFSLPSQDSSASTWVQTVKILQRTGNYSLFEEKVTSVSLTCQLLSYLHYPCGRGRTKGKKCPFNRDEISL